MNAVLGSPLVIVAAVASVIALISRWHPLAAVAFGVPCAVIASLLALASADRPRRLLWSAVAVAASAMSARALSAPPAMEWPVLGGIAGMRSLLVTPLATLVPEPESGIFSASSSASARASDPSFARPSP